MRRNTKTVYEWKKAYKEKEKLMLERGFSEVSSYEFYRDLFPEGSLQRTEHDGKGNVIATQIRPSGRGRTRQWIVDDSLKMLNKVMGDEFGLIPPLTFYGKTHTKQNAHELYAIAIDIDYVGKQQLKNLLKQFGNGIQLRPTYLISSGKGVHVYYFLKEPVQLYHNLEDTLAELKEALIYRLWNDTSSIKPDNPDITGIYQGFRCVGSQSKLGEDYPVKAYKISDNRYTLEDIRNSIPNCKVDLSVLTEKPKKEKSKLSLDEAKKLYPEWYQQRVVEGRSKKKRTWTCNEALYEWWKNKIFTKVKVGGRYFSIMALCAYGLKCGISERQIKQDAYSFWEHLESLTDDENNHFTKEDVKDALKALKANNKLLSTMASREWIEKQTKVSIPPNKRNGRKQVVHLKIARFVLEMMNEEREKPLQGRPKGSGTKRITVFRWRQGNPDGRKADCVRETGLTKPTVYKWWNEAKPIVFTEADRKKFISLQQQLQQEASLMIPKELPDSDKEKKALQEKLQQSVNKRSVELVKEAFGDDWWKYTVMFWKF